jgi:O-methyltransferase involved in polyketide biosynthesis
VRLAVTRCVPTSLTVSEPVEERLQVELGGVPETLLWTLYHRAVEARRPDAVLRDPKAVEVVERIDYPFEARFGSGRLGQWQALRVRCFDREIRRFLATHPDGTVVALGEGLETQFWRVDDGRVRWVGVDVSETVALRARLLPDEPRRRSVACSALDERWMDGIDASGGVLVTAQGLLMYFEQPDVHRLIAACASCDSGGRIGDAVGMEEASPAGRDDTTRVRAESVPSLCRFSRRGGVRRGRLVDPAACWTNCASRTSC